MNLTLMIVMAVVAMLAIIGLLPTLFAAAWIWKRAWGESRHAPFMRRLAFAVTRVKETTTLPTAKWVQWIAVRTARWGQRALPRANLANIAEGRHASAIVNRKTDAAITERYRIVKWGTDASHVAVTTGITDEPIGICMDEPAAAETNVAIQLLSNATGTVLMRAAGAITNGDLLEATANGRVQTLSTSAGVHYVVGRALGAATAAGNQVEVDVFYQRLVNYTATLMFAGIRTWAAGAAVTEGFAVAGVLATDMVLATPVAVAGAGLLQKVVPTTDTLTATTNANWANADKYTYQVWR